MIKEIKLLLFTIISLIFIILALIICKRYLKKDKSKDIVFFIVSIITVLIHYSSIIYELFQGKEVELLDTYYLPYYPCNVIMWQCLILGFLMVINKKGKFFRLLCSGTFFIGGVCAFVGIAFNINFLNNPDFYDFDILKGLLSHITLLFCCLYLYYEGYFKVDGFTNFISTVIQALIFLICGIYSNTFLQLQGYDYANSMFMRKSPIDSLPFVNFYICALLAFVIYLLAFTIYEIKTKPKNEVWFNKLKNKGEIKK